MTRIRISIISALLFFFVPMTLQAGAPGECSVPGSTVLWELDHCFLRSGTDDEEHSLVKACMDLAPSFAPKENCERKIKLKRYRCHYLIEQKAFDGTVQQCMDSKKTSGSIVRNGGVGGKRL